MTIDLIYGDCLEELPKLQDKSVDLILTDPPYGITDCKWDLVLNYENIWPEIWRVCNGSVCLFGSEPFSTSLRNSQITHFKYDWIWHKKMAGNIGLANKMPLKIHENISVFYKKQCLYNPQFHDNYTKLYGKYSAKAGKSTALATKNKKLSGKRGFPRSIQEFMRPNNKTGGGFHPTQKPVALLEYLIKTYTNEGDTVLDFCMGSGSTGVACKNLNRDFIGIEKEKKYFNIAKDRLNVCKN